MSINFEQLSFTEVPPSKSSRYKFSSTFLDNMKLPVHRWIRFSAGFSGSWAESVLHTVNERAVVLDPFVGSGTTLLASEITGHESYGVEAHPFVYRICKAKLQYRSDPNKYVKFANRVAQKARLLEGMVHDYPRLIRECFKKESLEGLDQLRHAYETLADNSPESDLVWLTILCILREVSHAGTAPWQYVLPRKNKKTAINPFAAYSSMVQTMSADMRAMSDAKGPRAKLVLSDARTCDGVPNNSIDTILTSPPYPNNYDYADATRLEMSFLGEVSGWSDLQETIRRHLVRSCSQHETAKTINLDEVLSSPLLGPINPDISRVCETLGSVRETRGGKKNYHIMIACYFLDLAKVWQALRRVCKTPSSTCFVIGDSAPYGVYVPVIDWLGELAIAGGFKSFTFEKTRDRNVKWKNRKHRVPLCEGRLWVNG